MLVLISIHKKYYSYNEYSENKKSRKQKEIFPQKVDFFLPS